MDVSWWESLWPLESNLFYRSKIMDWKKIKMVAAILKAIQPIIWDLVDDIIDAKDKKSDGGEKITKEERQQIILDNLLDIPAKIEPLIKGL
jgi:hypothetical protein